MSQSSNPSILSKKLERYTDPALATKADGVLDAVSLIAEIANGVGVETVAKEIKAMITDGNYQTLDAFGNLDAETELLRGNDAFNPGAYPFANVKQKGTLYIKFEDVLEGLNRYYDQKKNLTTSFTVLAKPPMGNDIDVFVTQYNGSPTGKKFKEVMDELLPMLSSIPSNIDQSDINFQITGGMKKARNKYRMEKQRRALRPDIQYDVDLLTDRLTALELLKPRFFIPTKYTGEGKYDTSVSDYFYNVYKKGGIQDTDILKSPQDLLHEELDDDLNNFGVVNVGFFEEVSSYEKSAYISEKDFHMENAVNGKEDEKLKRIFTRGKDYVKTVIDNYKGPKVSTGVMQRLDLNDSLILKVLGTTMTTSSVAPDEFELTVPNVEATAHGTLCLMLVCPEVVKLALSKKMRLTSKIKDPLPVKIIVAAQEKIHEIMYKKGMTMRDFMHAVYLVDLIIINNLSVSTLKTIVTGPTMPNINYMKGIMPIMSSTAIKLEVGVKFTVNATGTAQPLEYILGDPTKVLENTLITFNESTNQFVVRFKTPFTPGDQTFTKPFLNRFFDHKTGKARTLVTNPTTFDEAQICALERTVEAYQAGWNSKEDVSYFVKKVNSVNDY